ncbi:short-chain dehydrogenase [Aquabacterium sp. NJ1]|uniref:SDR family NAD(P)-dependent oxidoreductase n=1 Tax=Aquabacterium sp. NJ1 TaxID=1538295 RepID=UPI00052D9B6E|nr:SDR family NAD(P)-dependent oxidoreductase [Aquabacterium sp. NJ1]KGM40243.1 short-chain dehydrogenase [Aquabacterium sp. NJ1]
MSLNPPVTQWSGHTVWLIGASTGIGRATASKLHALGAQVIVSARNEAALQAFVAQHPGSAAVALDVVDAHSVRLAGQRVRELARQGRLDMVLYCAGYYKAMRAQEFDLHEAMRHQHINYDGALHVLDTVLPILLAQRGGHLSLVASVAGFRGLPKALAYGPTKAALNSLAETLYLDLHPQGIGISVINPGFVATPMTAHNDFSMPALLTPEQAAQEMIAGWEAGAFEIHFPRRFTLWLKLLRHLPHALYFPAVRRVTGQ